MIAAGGWLIGWADHYEKVGFWTIAVLIVLAVIGVVVDSVAQTAGAQRAGASKAGIVGSIVGTVVGIPMGLFGIFVMPLVGAAVGEFWAKRRRRHLGRHDRRHGCQSGAGFYNDGVPVLHLSDELIDRRSRI